MGKWLENWRKSRKENAAHSDIDTPFFWSIERCEGEIEPSIAFKALMGLASPGACIRLEGVSISKEVQSFLNDHTTDSVLGKSPDTIWPRPKVFHMPATEETLFALAEASKRHARWEICDHVFFYRDDRILVLWHDFLNPTTLMIADDFNEAQILEFCRGIGCEYLREANPCLPRTPKGTD